MSLPPLPKHTHASHEYESLHTSDSMQAYGQQCREAALLDIEQLRCGVMLQLLKIEVLTKERDELQKQVDDFCMAYRMKTDVENKKLTQERDALMIKNNELGDVYMRVCSTLDKTLAERDAALEQNTTLDARCAKLEAAGKLAWVAIVELRYSNSTDKSRSVSELAVQALREAGVQ